MEKKNNTHKLPVGWLLVKLEDISKQITDGSHNPPRNIGSGIPMISARNIENNRISFEEVRYIDEEDYKYENQKTKIEGGDVLLTVVGTIGRCAYISDNIDTKFTLQRSVAAIKPLISGKYLMYYIQSPNFQKQLIDNAKGTAQKGIYLKTLSSLELPLPPLNEQNRIVAKIEELFSELDHAEAVLNKTQKQLEIYKQVILTSCYQKREGYKLVKVSELGTILTGNTPLKNNADFFGGEFNFYKPSDLNSGFFVVNSLDKLSSNGYKIARTAPEGSILVTCIGATIGKTGLIRKEGAFNQQINAIIPNQNFLPEFIFYQIISPEFQLQLKQKTSSTTIPIINKGKFLQLNVIQFPLDLQQQIVQELESKFTLIENLETTIENELKKTKAFSQTILKKAFEGNLLQQNANDEQAIYLLEKIQIEKNNFLKLQKENIKKKTKIERAMESEKSILEILQQLDTPISAHELWQQSVHHADIEKFYAELKTIQCKIEEIREGMNTKIHLKP